MSAPLIYARANARAQRLKLNMGLSGELTGKAVADPNPLFTIARPFFLLFPLAARISNDLKPLPINFASL